MLSLDDNAVRTEHIFFFLPFLRKVEIKVYNVMTDGCNVFDQPVKNETRTYNSIKKNFTGPGDDNIITHYMITCSLLDYAYFKKTTISLQ